MEVTCLMARGLKAREGEKRRDVWKNKTNLGFCIRSWSGRGLRAILNLGRSQGAP